jgi:hypothetical protein
MARKQGVLLEAVAAAAVANELGEYALGFEADAAPSGISRFSKAMASRGRAATDGAWPGRPARVLDADPPQIGRQLVLAISHGSPVAWAARGPRRIARRIGGGLPAAMPGPMRAVLRWLGTILLFLTAGLCFLPTARSRPFSTALYYVGSASDHFDGEALRQSGRPGPGSGPGRHFFSRWTTFRGAGRSGRCHVPVTPIVAAARVEGA